MKFKEGIKKLLKDNNLTQEEFCKKGGYKSQGSFSNQLARGNMTVKSIIRICNVLGYELVLRPKEGTNKAERTIALEADE